MQLSEILDTSLIIYPLEVKTKSGVIMALIDLLHSAGKIHNPDEAKQAVLQREELMSTGVGRGVALPHGKCPHIEEVFVAVGVSQQGIDFDAVDEQPAQIFVLLLTPEKYPSKHLKLLSKFSRMLNTAKCREEILQAKSPSAIADIFYRYEQLV